MYSSGNSSTTKQFTVLSEYISNLYPVVLKSRPERWFCHWQDSVSTLQERRPRRESRPEGRSYSAIILPLVLVLSLASASLHAATQERPDDELRQILVEAIQSSDSFSDRFDAEVWLTDMSGRLNNKVESPEERLLILKTVHYEAARAELPPELVLAVIDIESNFDRFALSYAGARGLMQVMPFWLDEIGRPGDDLFDIHTNLRMGCTILRHYLDRERGNRVKALARYNGSVGQNWYPQLVFKALNLRWYQR